MSKGLSKANRHRLKCLTAKATETRQVAVVVTATAAAAATETQSVALGSESRASGYSTRARAAELELLKQEKERLEARNADLSARLDSQGYLAERSKELEEENCSLKKRVEDLEGALVKQEKNFEQNLKDTDARVQSLILLKESKRRSLYRIKKRADDLEVTNSSFKERLDELQRGILKKNEELTQALAQTLQSSQLLDQAQKELELTKGALCLPYESYTSLKKELGASMEKLSGLSLLNESLASKLEGSRSRSHRYYDRYQRAKRKKNQCLKVIKKANMVFNLTQKGVYTPGFRSLIRSLVQLGCPARKTGQVLDCTIGYIANWVAMPRRLKRVRKVSCRTVRRVILEGGVAADIQAGYEISKAPGE